MSETGKEAVVVEGNKVGRDGAAETVVNGEGLGTKETFAAVVENGRRLGSK
ncbi:hypothetical protein A2U01_0086423, partial [Trifolium medium]|nr:hypothetical protein [Trifolium medium]